MAGHGTGDVLITSIVALMSIAFLLLSSSHESGHQARESKRELEAEILLEVTAEVVTVEVVQNLESLSTWQDVA